MHLVKANGAEIPAIGFGTWTLKGQDCHRMVTAALDSGYMHIDTAAMYDNEVEVGEAIRNHTRPRDDLFVTTKVWWTDIDDGDLQRSAEDSLKRLGMSAVDLFLIHWPNPRIPLERSIRALNEVKSSGMARHIGVSNFPTATLAEALHRTTEPLVCNQVEYHPYINQDRVHAALGEAGMAMTSYCPLYRGGPLFEEPAVKAAAASHGKSPAQIVLRWHVQQPGVVCIPRTSRVERVPENLAIFDFSLTDAEMAAISELRGAGKRICDFDFSPNWDPQ